MTLEEFKKRFLDLKNKGFVQSLRSRSTGVGYTFETLIGIEENNLALPDIDGIEIKTHREGSSSMISLFTTDRKAWKMNPLVAVRKYGSLDKNGRIGMYYTMSRTPNSAGLLIDVSENAVTIRHISGEILASWPLESLVVAFQKKMPALLLVHAETEKRGEVEYFHFRRAQLMRGTTPERLGELISNEDVLVDLRLHDAQTKARNHGTGFRAHVSKLPKLFSNITEI